jgi:ATP-binding cassette subfamily B protein
VDKREFRLEKEYRYNRSGPLRWIVSHLRRYPQFPLAAIAAAIMNNICYASIPIFIGRAFGLISSSGLLAVLGQGLALQLWPGPGLVSSPSWPLTALVGVALAVMGLAIGQSLTGLIRNGSVEFLAQRIERDARDELYLSLLGKSQTFHGRQRIGDIMARATNDVHMLNLMFSPGLMLILDSAMGTVVPLVMIGLLKWQLLLVPGIFLVFLAITLVDYNRRLNPVSLALREQFGTMNTGLAEAIAGIEVVKANVQERHERDKFTLNARAYRDYYIRQGQIQALYLPALAFAVAWAAGFLHALLLWQAGGARVEDLAWVVSYVGLLATLRFPTYISTFTFNLVQIGVASARRILELINSETDLDENKAGVAQPIRGEVIFENVSFGYNGRPVLQGITFAARPGETIAIVGETGSGKTSLTRLINRIFDTDRGRVLVDGVDVRAWNLESLRSQISTIEQDVFLFSRTIAENIAFGCPDASHEAIERAAVDAQAHEFISSFPDGYETKVGERGVTLSGGQRQRIAIARAFLTEPRILILDDSTSAIDSATEDQIQRAMRRVSKKQTTFLITHRISQIRWADRILVLRRGRLVDQGKHEELMERCGDYRRIFARYE